jgi:hypothetical protein
MEPGGRDPRSLFSSRTLLGFALLTALGARAALSEHTTQGFVSPVDPFLAVAADAAIAAAESQLLNPRCEAIFSDFHDPSGAPLQAALDRLGVSGGAFLRSLTYANGEHLSLCEPGVLAGTRTGGRVIYLCGSRFASAQRRNPRLGAALILHEALHALGLSENPPTSLQITAAVLGRCGR